MIALIALAMKKSAVVILLLWVVLGTAMTTEQPGTSTEGVQRQFILPPNTGQMPIYNSPFNKNPPMLPSVNGMPAAGSREVTPQQVEDQINQLNQLSQQLRAMPHSPAIEQTAKGQQVPIARYLPQGTGGLPGNGMTRLAGMDSNYIKKIARNPLTGPNGLTKDVLSDLMFGSLKGLAATGGLSNFNNQMTDETLPPRPPQFGNLPMGGYTNPMIDEKINTMRNSQLQNVGTPSIGLPIAPYENMNFGDLPNNDLPSSDLNDLKNLPQLQTRHHAKHKSKKKGDRSDAVTKLLLTLLVDKLKDIYEMDKINSTQKQRVKVHSSTIGKIGNMLKERSHPPNRNNNTSNHLSTDDQNDSTLNSFATNLSFPLTFSDSKGVQLSLVTPTKKSSEGNSPLLDVDTQSIEKIINSIEEGEGNSSTQIEGIRGDPGNSPHEISQKTTKTLNDDDMRRLLNGGSEFHQVKAEPEGVLGKAKSITSISDFHPSIGLSKPTEPPVGIFEVHTDKATVSTLPTFSISSLLNQEVPGTIKGSNRVLKPTSPQENAVSPKLSDLLSTKQAFVSATIQDKPDLSKKLDENDAGNYLEASRVLGAVFNKVKDPLARKSVETAIKAMLKLMKSNSNYSKKQSVPSIEQSSNLREKVKKLMLTIHELSKILGTVQKKVPRKKKRYWLPKRKSHKKHWAHHKRHHWHRHKNMLLSK